MTEQQPRSQSITHNDGAADTAGPTPNDEHYSYKFKLYKSYIYEGKQKTTYQARWSVAGLKFKETYDDETAMSDFIADLEYAKRAHQRFRLDDGRPVGMAPYRPKRALKREPRRASKSAAPTEPGNCFTYLRKYVKSRWKGVSGKQRGNMAEAFMWVVVALLPRSPRRPDEKLLRRSLRSFAFNCGAKTIPEAETKVLAWVAEHAPPIDVLESDEGLRDIYAQFSVCLDGTPRAAESRKRYHHILNPAVEDAVKQGLLTKNRLEDYRSNGRRTRVRQKSEQIDKRICPNIEQFRRLHATMMTLERLGPMIATYYALMFWAALRPEEAANVRWANIGLPATDTEWGELILDSAAPTVGSKWTLDGSVREHRELKACEIGDTRVVPLCPELVAILRRHRIAHRKCPNGQVFWGERGDMLSDSTCRSMLKRAREKAFTTEEQASPVAKTPYDFRHACITRWLNALIPVADVAKWSGNSPAIIHRKYEHCVAAQMKRLQALIEAADRDATTPIETAELVAA